MNLSTGQMADDDCTSSPVESGEMTFTATGSHSEDKSNATENKREQSHDDLPVPLLGFTYQEPTGNGLDSVPQTSVTDSTQTTNRKILLVPASQVQFLSECNHSSSILAESPDEQQKLINMIIHGQRGRIEEQRCFLAPSKSAPCTPKHTGSDIETLFSLLAFSQSQRLNDQRLFLPSLPGLEKQNSTSNSGGDSSYLCYLISKVQDSRFEDQRCALPSIPATIAQITIPKDLDSESFFNLLADSQGRRLNDQRVFLPTLPGIQNGNATSTTTSGSDVSYLCYLISKVQGSRMDEQRCSAPHIFQNQSTPSFGCKDHQISGRFPKSLRRSASLNLLKTDRRRQEISQADLEHFIKMIHHAQRGRMEEQRCYLQLSQSTPATATHNGSTLNSLFRGAEAEAFFTIIAASQARRLDDQRFPLPVLPGIGVNAEEKENCSNSKLFFCKASPQHVPTVESMPVTSRKDAACQSQMLDAESGNPSTLPTSDSLTPDITMEDQKNQNWATQASPPQITQAKSTPSASEQDCSELSSQSQMDNTESVSPIRLPKSASFTPETEHQTKQNDPAQVKMRVSMNFTPQQGHDNADQPCTFPEVFLTLGAPGDTLVIPLSPVPGRSLFLNLNLVPKEAVTSSQSSPSGASPRKVGSSASSPNTPVTNKASYPHEQEKLVTSPISPDEDYFSLIEKVHTAQLQKAMGQGGQKWKGDCGMGKEKTKQGKRKEGRKKDRGKNQ